MEQNSNHQPEKDSMQNQDPNKKASQDTDQNAEQETNKNSEQEKTNTLTPDWCNLDVKNSVNPLLKWAAPIFTVASRLREGSAKTENSEQLTQDVTQLLKYLQHQLHVTSHSPAQTIAILYASISLIEKSIAQHNYSKEIKNITPQLEKTFNMDSDQSKSYFKVLEHSAERPHDNLDFLEFNYLCMQMGSPSLTDKSSDERTNEINKSLHEILLQHQRITNDNSTIKKQLTHRSYIRSALNIKYYWWILIAAVFYSIILTQTIWHQNKLQKEIDQQVRQFTYISIAKPSSGKNPSMKTLRRDPVCLKDQS